MGLEQTLAGWTGPSSPTEQEKQERTERMVREAIAAHGAFDGYPFRVYAKGSYPNNTNVRADSDVDIVVECRDCVYSDVAPGVVRPAGTAYTGPWTPDKLRAEVAAALRAKFPGQVDTTGSVALRVRSSTARVDADVVPSFSYKFYASANDVREGTRIFSKSGAAIVNYPAQHLANGRTKNTNTGMNFKKAVRIVKRTEGAMLRDGQHSEVPSFFLECLVYNTPNDVLRRRTWTEVTKGVLVNIWDNTQGDDEPASGRWVEVNECKYLFGAHQKWTREDAREFALAAWKYLGF